MTNKSNKKQKPESNKPKKSGAAKFLIFAAIFYTVFFVIVFFAFRTEGSSDLDRTQFCYDDWGVFTSSQISELDSHCKNVQNKTGLTVFIATCERKDRLENYNGSPSYGYDYDGRYYADMDGIDFCRKYSLSYEDNFAVIIINTQKNKDTEHCYNYHFDIYTYGDAYSKVGDGEIQAILFCEGGDMILSSSSQNAVEGLKECVTLTGKAYKWIVPNVSWNSIFIGAIIISGIISLIVILCIRRSYTRNRSNETFSFANNSKLNLSLRQDNYLRSTTTFTRISSSSGSSGGRSFGGGRSGGGGGGGHRGGR